MDDQRTNREGSRSVTDINKFIDLLVNSDLCSKNEANELLGRFQETHGSVPTKVDEFCEFLIATNLFTAYQCDMLRRGKWKGFFMNNYLLLELIGRDNEFTYYKARDARTGKLARLTISPPPYTQGIDYRADPYAE